MKKLVICITGGIASGKTTVSNHFAKLGAHIVDADLVSRVVVAKKSVGLMGLVKQYGKKILLESGGLNREKLASIIFVDAEQRKFVDNLLHPLIRKMMVIEVEQLKAGIVAVVIPLFLPKQINIHFDRILVVDVNQEIQLKRLIQRNTISAKSAVSRVNAQISRSDRLAFANDVLVNNESRMALIDSTEMVFKMYASCCSPEAL